MLLFAFPCVPRSPAARRSLPLNVEFGTFSLLALFYASTIQRHRDKSRWESSLRRGYYWAYGALNLLLLCADAAWVAWSLVSSGEAGLSARSSQIRALISAGVFTVLAGILVLFAAQIGALLSRYPNMRLPFQAKSTSNGDMIALTALLAFLFVSRCVYNYLAAFGIVSVSMTAQGTARSALVIFFLFFAWEIAPTALVVVMTLHIPSAKRLQYEARNPYAHRAPRYGPINVDATVSVRSPLFANPNRYESDDDAPAQIPASPALYGAPGQYRR